MRVSNTNKPKFRYLPPVFIKLIRFFERKSMLFKKKIAQIHQVVEDCLVYSYILTLANLPQTTAICLNNLGFHLISGVRF